MSDRHQLELREDGWAVEHTDECKQGGSLLDCIIHRRAHMTFSGEDGIAVARNIGFGRYFVTASDLPGSLEYEPVSPDGSSAP